MKQPAVMITGVGGGGVGEQILKALRMSNVPYFIIGSDTDEFSLGLANVDLPYILPKAHDDRYVEVLVDLCKKNGVQALFHGSEAELKVMSENRVRFQEAGIFLPISPSGVINLCSNKLHTSEWLFSKGYNVPQTVLVNSDSDLEGIDFFPAVLKPVIGGGGSANLFIAQTNEELRFLGSSLLSNIGPFIVQEYIGTVDSEYTVGVLSDMAGNIINSIAVRRIITSGLSNRVKVENRTNRSELGTVLAISSGISQGEIGNFPKVTKTCEQIALELSSTGSINIQCRLVDNKVYVFEINPRFSGTTSLRAMVGYNEPDILIRKHLLGEEILPHFNYQSGRIARGLSETLLPPREIIRAV